MFVKKEALGDGLTGQLHWQGRSDLKSLASMSFFFQKFLMKARVFSFSVLQI